MAGRPRQLRWLALSVGFAGQGLGLGSCGHPPSGSETGAPLRDRAATAYVLTAADIPLAGFAATTPPTAVDAAGLAEGDPARAGRLRVAGLRAAAVARYFRSVPELRTASGPIDVISDVGRFGDIAGAGRAFRDEAAREDGLPGAVTLSTGRLADESHAVLVTAGAPDGTPVAQTVLSWRVANLVSVLVVRERLAGSPLEHALTLARAQLARQGVSPAPPAP